MAKIGGQFTLKIVHERPFGAFLDAGELGEILLPRREVPADRSTGDSVTVFLYLDSEDRPIATTATPLVMPGNFARLKCIGVTPVGAFLDWGLPKDLLVPFREQKSRMEEGRHYLVHVHVDEASGRIVASTRLTRHLDLGPHDFRPGQEVPLMVFAKTELGYKAIVGGSHSGLLYHKDVFQPLQSGEILTGYVASVRADGKMDLTLQPPGRTRIDDLESRILAELEARGGFWAIGDHSPAEEIHEELGVSKRTFKQATGALLRKQKIAFEPKGIRLLDS